MAVAQGRRAEALILFDILFAANADVANVEQADDRGDDGVMVGRLAVQIALHLRAEERQGTAEIGKAVIFFRIPLRAEIDVIAILLAALGVISDRLDVPMGRRAVPGVDISGRQGDLVQPVDLLAVGDAVALGIPIAPAVPDLLARDARHFRVDVNQLHAD